MRYIYKLSSNRIVTPSVISGMVSSWAQFTIEVEDPDALAGGLGKAGIPTARYYPRPTHLQTAYQSYPIGAGGLANTDGASKRVISLPMHAYLGAESQAKVVQLIKENV